MVAAAVGLSVKCRKVRGLLLPGHEQHRRDFPERRGTRLAQHMDASVYVHPDQAAQALSIILDGGFCTCARGRLPTCWIAVQMQLVGRRLPELFVDVVRATLLIGNYPAFPSEARQ